MSPMKQATPRAGVGGLRPFPHPFLESTGPPCHNPSDSTRTRRGWTGSIRPLESISHPEWLGRAEEESPALGTVYPKVSPLYTFSPRTTELPEPWPPSRKPPFQRTEDFMSQGAVGRPVATPPDVFRGRRIEAGTEHTECVPVHTHTHTHTRVSKTQPRAHTLLRHVYLGKKQTQPPNTHNQDTSLK